MQERINILIASGVPDDRQFLKRSLQEYHPSAEFQEVTTCSEAESAILNGGFDGVFLANTLPDDSGTNCLNHVRDAGVRTPVVLITEAGEDFLAIDTTKAGATVFLPREDLTPQLLDHSLRNAMRFHFSQEQILRTQEELRLRDRAIAASSNGIVICDPHQADCPIIYANPAFSTITGYPMEEVIGRNCRFLQGHDTDPCSVDQVRECVSQEWDCQIVLQNYKKDGTPFWNELTISPVRDSSGRLTHFIGVQTDITERKNAEEDLRQSIARQQSLLKDVFSSVTEGRLILCASENDLPAPLTRFGGPIILTAIAGIRELRRQCVVASGVAGLPDDRRDDLETAVGEAAMNAVVHSSTGTGRVFLQESGIVQVWVKDEGKGISVANLPNATLRRGFSTAGTMGQGFKMILSLVDRVYLLTSSAGTTIVMEQDREAVLPSW